MQTNRTVKLFFTACFKCLSGCWILQTDVIQTGLAKVLLNFYWKINLSKRIRTFYERQPFEPSLESCSVLFLISNFQTYFNSPSLQLVKNIFKAKQMNVFFLSTISVKIFSFFERSIIYVIASQLKVVKTKLFFAVVISGDKGGSTSKDKSKFYFLMLKKKLSTS